MRNPINDHDDENSPFALNRKGLQRHVQSLRATGMLGPETVAKSVVYPGTDSMSVHRAGPVNVSSTVVEVTLIDGQTKGVCFLTAADARRLGAAMLNIAEEIDGKDPIRISVAKGAAS